MRMHKGAPLRTNERARLAQLYEEHDRNENTLAAEIGISRHALARAMGGLNIYTATTTCIRAYLDAHRAAA